MKPKSKAKAKTPAKAKAKPFPNLFPKLVQEDSLFLQALDRAIDFHHNNTNDPHHLAVAVSVALREVRKAYAHSRGLP